MNIQVLLLGTALATYFCQMPRCSAGVKFCSGHRCTSSTPLSHEAVSSLRKPAQSTPLYRTSPSRRLLPTGVNRRQPPRDRQTRACCPSPFKARGTKYRAAAGGRAAAGRTVAPVAPRTPPARSRRHSHGRRSLKHDAPV